MKIAIYFLCVAAVFGSCILFAQDSEVAGNEKVADIIKNYEGRGTLSDGSDPTPPEEALKGFRIREGLKLNSSQASRSLDSRFILAGIPKGGCG